jgi:hypothetical protein
MERVFLIDGQPMLLPDEDMEVSFEDLDSASAGRDQSGVMHRIVVRHKVGKWNFCYSRLDRKQYAYMESLFAGKSQFRFTYPSLTDPNQSLTVTAYRSAYGLGWRNARTGEYRNYKFSVIEC